MVSRAMTVNEVKPERSEHLLQSRDPGTHDTLKFGYNSGTTVTSDSFLNKTITRLS